MGLTTTAPPVRTAQLTRRFLLPAVAAVLGALVTAIPWLVATLDHDQIQALEVRLAGEARHAGTVIPWGERGPRLDEIVRALGDQLGARITVIAPDGVVIGESSQPSAELVNHADRAEVRAALADGLGHTVRWSTTLDRRLLYVAWRQTGEAETRIIRISVPVSSLWEYVLRLRAPIAFALVSALGFGIFVAWLLSGAMVRRIQRLVRFGAALAGGTPPPPLGPERNDDLGILETQLAEMARNVAHTLAAVRVERERLEAILRGMVEGVVVTDLTGHVVLLNARARELLDLPPGVDPMGRALIELVRDPGLADLPRELASGPATLSRNLSLRGGSGPSLQLNAARLTADDGAPFGFVLVLHDVSELRRLETVRRDFVANVSHEIRTPLTAIKGYAETLLGPAGEERDTAIRFLQVIDRHSERLGRLIDDLLTLSDLEFGRTPPRRRPLAVEPVIDDVVQILGDRAEQRGIALTTDVHGSTPAVDADGDQLRQVLINLVDNAIKYTPDGGTVHLGAAASRDGADVDFTVVDTGPGIPSQDLPRLTERFFRVDKARSRELGGTGLGLAIVKHIVQAHGGKLVIDSAVGCGTTVRVSMPAARDDTAVNAS